MLEDQKSYSFYLNNAPGITQCVADLLKQLNLQLCQLAKDTICTTWRSHVNIRCQKDSYSLTSTKRNKQPTYNLLFHRSRIETVAILKWSENLHIKHFYFLQIIVKLKKCCTCQLSPRRTRLVRLERCPSYRQSNKGSKERSRVFLAL